MPDDTFALITAEALVDLAKHEQKPYILDVREADEYAVLRTTLSHLVPLSLLAQGQGLDRIKATKDQAIYVICRSGKRSMSACQILHDAGFTKLYNVVGGMEAWRQGQLPYLQGPAQDR